jgi:diguanylate cyclase (GGDEF)-like protein
VPALVGLGGLVAVLGIGAFLLSRWRTEPARPLPSTAPPTLLAQAPTTVDMRELLEVSRRLTSAASTGDIDRAVVRDALGLVPAAGAALIRQRGEELEVGHESRPDLIVVEGLPRGVVQRVAETGQPIAQVSATEPAIRNLPAAMVAVPLVGAGRVQAVLLVVRSDTQPFSAKERAILDSLAPVAAAALATAEQARASMEQSLVDPLTGAGNRRRFDGESAKVLADGRPTALFMVDLDHFKSVNDTHGHAAGDALLKAIVRLIRDTVRPIDSVYRFGGEEFCGLLPDTTLDEAVAVAERVRARIAESAFSAGLPEPLRATASLGVSTSTDTDVAALVARADAALYEAKGSGRNQVRHR